MSGDNGGDSTEVNTSDRGNTPGEDVWRRNQGRASEHPAAGLTGKVFSLDVLFYVFIHLKENQKLGR